MTSSTTAAFLFELIWCFSGSEQFKNLFSYNEYFSKFTHLKKYL